MKDLRLVLLFALPVAAIVAGVLVVNTNVDPAPPAETQEADRAVDDSPEGVQNRTVPVKWPEVEHPRGSDPIVLSEGPEDFDWSLTAKRLRALLEKGGQEDWSTIEQLLIRGEIEDGSAIAKILVEELKKSPELAGVWIAKLVPMLVARREEVRDQVVEDLLSAARGAEHENTVKAAALAIGSIAGAGAVSSLADLARDCENLNAAGAAIRAIGAIGAREPAAAASELARLLTELSRPELGQSLCEAIGMVRSPEMVHALVPFTGEASTREVRMLAVDGLGATKQPGAVPILAELSRSATDRDLATRAVIALGRHGSKEAVERLIELTKEGGELAQAAGGIIGEASGRGIYEPILRSFSSAPDATVKGRWLQAISASREPAAIPGVLEILRSRDEKSYVRGEAAVTLAKLGAAESTSELIRTLESSERSEVNMRMNLIKALKILAPNPRARDTLQEQAVPVLERMVGDGFDDPADFEAQRLLNLLRRK